MLRGGNVENPVELNKDDPLAVLCFGDTAFVTRYLLGFDERLSIILKNNDVSYDVIEDIVSDCKDDLQLPLGVPAMPIQDAIDLVRFLTEISVNSSRFVPGAQLLADLLILRSLQNTKDSNGLVENIIIIKI